MKCKLIIFIIFLFFVFPQKISAQVVINEFLPNHSSGVDWVELYSATDIDISGWILKDSTSPVVTRAKAQLLLDAATMSQANTEGTTLGKFLKETKEKQNPSK